MVLGNAMVCVPTNHFVMRLLPNGAHSGALSSILLCAWDACAETEHSERRYNDYVCLSPLRLRSQSVVLVPV